MRALCADEIIQAFRERDRRLLPVPAVDDVIWQDLAYFGWVDPQGHRGYVVCEVADELVGVVFRMNKGDSSLSGGMCDICFSSYPIAATKPMMTQSWTHPERSYGIHLCRHLDCSDAITGKRRSNQLMETMDQSERLKRVKDKMARFILRVTQG